MEAEISSSWRLRQDGSLVCHWESRDSMDRLESANRDRKEEVDSKDAAELDLVGRDWWRLESRSSIAKRFLLRRSELPSSSMAALNTEMQGRRLLDRGSKDRKQKIVN